MAVVPSDLPVQWSVEFETLFLAEFNQTVNVDRARLDPKDPRLPSRRCGPSSARPPKAGKPTTAGSTVCASSPALRPARP